MKKMLIFLTKLKKIKCNKFILISTINVYPDLNSKLTEYENLDIKNSIDYYGKHRLIFEKFIIDTYENYHILRLPSIYGDKLNKGILYDLLNQNYLENICIYDTLQFYDLSTIKDDIDYVCNNNIKILNLVSEPITVKDIITTIFTDYKIINDLQIEYKNNIINLKKRQPKLMNICSSYFEKNYIYNKELSIKKINNFQQNYKTVNVFSISFST